jgi:hypothetical protein
MTGPAGWKGTYRVTTPTASRGDGSAWIIREAVLAAALEIIDRDGHLGGN